MGRRSSTISLDLGEKVLLAFALLIDLGLVPSVTVLLMSLTTPHASHTFLVPFAAWALVIEYARVRSTDLLLSAVVLACAVWLIYQNRRADFAAGGATPVRGSTAYGSARWRTGAELASGLGRWVAGQPKNPAGLVAGADKGGRKVTRAWVVSQDGHNLVIGAPGAGKTSRLIEPSLLVIAQSGESVVITDPKGELFENTSGLFEQAGYDVLRFDLRDPSLSLRWNPLGPVTEALGRNDAGLATRRARELAQILSSQGTGGSGENQFWHQSAVNLATALVLAVASKADPTRAHLASVYRTLIDTKDLDHFFAGFPGGHPAAMAYGPVKLSQAETRQSQLAVTAASLALFGDPGVAWMTAASEFDPASLAQSRRAVYVVVPDDSSAYYPLATLFVVQILQALAGVAARQVGSRLKSPVHFVLDEFGSFPAVPDWDKVMAVSRGRGIRLSLVVQALSQLEATYGESVAATIRNSCNTWVYLSSNDEDTARLVSEKAGQATIQTTSQSMNYPGQGPGGQNQTTSYAARSLLTLDEVMRWPFGESLVLQSGRLPARFPLRIFGEWPGAEAFAVSLRERPAEYPPTWTPEEAQDTRFVMS